MENKAPRTFGHAWDYFYVYSTFDKINGLKLDLHYVTYAPAFSFDKCLSHTNILLRVVIIVVYRSFLFIALHMVSNLTKFTLLSQQCY